MALIATPAPTAYDLTGTLGRVKLNALWISTTPGSAYATTIHDPDGGSPTSNVDILSYNKLFNPTFSFVDNNGARVPQVAFEYQAGFNDAWFNKLIDLMQTGFDFSNSSLPMAGRLDDGTGFEFRGEAYLTSDVALLNSGFSRRISMTWILPEWKHENES